MSPKIYWVIGARLRTLTTAAAKNVSTVALPIHFYTNNNAPINAAKRPPPLKRHIIKSLFRKTVQG